MKPACGSIVFQTTTSKHLYSWSLLITDRKLQVSDHVSIINVTQPTTGAQAQYLLDSPGYHRRSRYPVG